ncbi:MAG: DUF4811 domain-containing protein [Lactobacillus sp.]|jgi:hypothetical protein|nr:DUF4811 domain-containing protein [Lactobacillus sp.]
MLLLISVLLAFAIGFLFYLRRHGLALCLVAILLLIQGSLLLDVHYHYGTKVTTTTTVAKVAPIVNVHNNEIMVAQPVKQGKTIYTAYATKNPNTYETSTILNKSKTVVIKHQGNSKAQRSTQNTQYVYQNALARALFFGITNQNQLKKQVITYHLPSNWYLLSKKQLTQVGKQLRSKNYQAQLQNNVKAKLTTQLKQTPSLAQQPQKLQQLKNQYIQQTIAASLPRQS